MYATPLAPDEPLSPELVLVLPPELRAQVLARLLAPVWAQPRPPILVASPAYEPIARTLARIVISRTVQFAQIFVAITILTVAMAFIAKAVR